MTEPKKPFQSSTASVHAGQPSPRPHNTLAPAIAQTATYTFSSTADLEQYMRGEDKDPEREEYGRYGNPTVREVETRAAALKSAARVLHGETGLECRDLMEIVGLDASACA